jgi:phosphoglycolate phosphatase
MDGLIFDLDGTLVDTLCDIATAINLTRARFALAPLPERDITRHVGNGSEYLVRQTVPVPDATFEAAHRCYGTFYAEHMLDRSRLHEGAEEILRRFEGRALAVITNKPLSQTEQLLKGLGVRGYFGTVLGGDSLEKKKPDPLPIRFFMERHGLTPGRVVIVGDGLNDVRGGKAAGIMTVAATFGVSSREELAGEGADHIIDHFSELLEIVC